ncbi:MAG: carbohydrate binding domain-containing protein [Bacteroidales bacterium]|nr:carbohydrate binding domain-containing protein [Bacteroidales bacterium]
MKSRSLLLIIPLTCISITLSAQYFSFEKKMVSIHRSEFSRYGYNISTSGNFAIIGSIFDPLDENGENYVYYAGAACMYLRNDSGKWTFMQKIADPDRTMSGCFGYSVAVSGNTAVIGSLLSTITDSNGNPTGKKGAAHIYEYDGQNNWTHKNKLVIPDLSGIDYFCHKVAIYGDYVAVSAPNENDDTSSVTYDVGYVYIFERDAGGTWQQITKLSAFDRQDGDFFGWDLSLSNNTLVVGVRYESEDQNGSGTVLNAGSAYIFERNPSLPVWNFKQKIVAPDRSENDYFGQSVSIYGDYIIIGANSEDQDEHNSNTLSAAGSAYIYKRDASNYWSFYQKLTASNRKAGDKFGSSVFLYDSMAVIGATNADMDENNLDSIADAGLVYIFEMDETGNWEEKQIISALHRAKDDRFGYSISGADNYLFCGSPYHDLNLSGEDSIDNAGVVCLYERCNGNPDPVAGNIIENGDFEECMLSPWQKFNSTIDDVVATYQVIDGACKVIPHKLSPSPEIWHVQLAQPFSPSQIDELEQNKTYTLSFTARAEEDYRPCQIYFGQNETPYEAVLDELILLYTEPDTFSFEFKMDSVYSTMSLAFDIGNEKSWACFDNIVLLEKETAGIQDNLSSLIRIHPNPATDHIKISGTELIKAQLYNLTGMLVKEQAVKNTEIMLNTMNLPKGIYIVKVSSLNSETSKKIIIQ